MRRISAVLILSLIILSSCDSIRTIFDEAGSNLRKASSSDPVSVRVIPVSNSQMTGMLSYVGTIESSRSSVITSPSSGSVASVYVREGQRVNAGTPLVKIESQTLQSAYDLAKATLDQARDAMERLEQVYGSGSVSELKMVEMRTNLGKAEASERAAAKALSDCVVKAPFSGVVNDLNISAGEDAEFARVLMRIVDPSSLEIHFSLPESEYGDVSVGDIATVTVPAIGADFSAKVKVKGAVASILSHSYDCALGDFSPRDNMMPGMVCKVYLSQGDGSGMVIPSSAVMTDKEGRYVWVVRNGIVSKEYILVGGYSGNGIVVSDGLSEDDAVIVEGARKVSTGMSVKVIE